MFETKGDAAEWQKVYDAISKQIGEVITYKQLDAILGRPFRDARSPIYRVAREMEENDHRTLKVKQGVGYEVAKPEEHEGLGHQHRLKSMRQLVRAKRRFSSADRSQLSRETVARLDMLQARVDELESGVRYLKKRADRVEAAHKGVEAKVDENASALDAKIKAIQETLKRHGMTD